MLATSLWEYLSAQPDLCSRPHWVMAEICLTYLNSKQVKALSTVPSPDTQNTRFLEHSSVYWEVHVKRQLLDCGRLLALVLLKENSSQISTKLLLAHAGLYDLGHDIFPPFSGLHCASLFGTAEVVAALIEVGGSDINGEMFCSFFYTSIRSRYDFLIKLWYGRDGWYGRDKT